MGKETNHTSNKIKISLQAFKSGYLSFVLGLALTIAALAFSLGLGQFLQSLYLEITFIALLLVFGSILAINGLDILLKPKNMKRLFASYALSIGSFDVVVLMQFFSKSFTNSLLYPVALVILTVCLSAITLTSLIVLPKTSKVESSVPVKETPFSEVRDNLDSAISDSANLSSKLELLKQEMNACGNANFQKEKETEDKYYNTLTDVFQLLDHFQMVYDQNKQTEEVGWLRERAQRILEDQKISEMPVNRGDAFDARYHKYVGKRADDLPRGSISAVARKGYVLKGQNGEMEVLRVAEVLVSDNQPNKSQTKPNGVV